MMKSNSNTKLEQKVLDYEAKKDSGLRNKVITLFMTGEIPDNIVDCIYDIESGDNYFQVDNDKIFNWLVENYESIKELLD